MADRSGTVRNKKMSHSLEYAFILQGTQNSMLAMF